MWHRFLQGAETVPKQELRDENTEPGKLVFTHAKKFNKMKSEKCEIGRLEVKASRSSEYLCYCLQCVCHGSFAVTAFLNN